MCSECAQIAFYHRVLMAEKNQESFELANSLLPYYLQETSNLAGGINNAKGLENFSGYPETVFCRLYEQNILNGFDPSLSKFIMSSFDREAINSYLEDRRMFIGDNTWHALGFGELYRAEEGWNNFVRDKSQLINSSLNALQPYYEWWIDGKTASEPTDILESDLDRFQSLFPILYFSLIYLSKYSKASRIIKDIALNRQFGRTFVCSNDSWLQRKAFVCCIREEGVRFISDNVRNVRCALIYHALLKIDFGLHDLQELKNLVSGEKSHFPVAVELSNVSHLIDFMILMHTPSDLLDPTLILKVKNAERRKELVGKIGIERVISKLGGRIIDSWNGYELLELDIPDMSIRPKYLKMKNPSIGTYHFEGVPPEITACQEALSWRVGGLEWNPEQLT